MIPRRSSLVNCFGSGNEATRSSIMLSIFGWIKFSESLCDCGEKAIVVMVLPSFLVVYRGFNKFAKCGPLLRVSRTSIRWAPSSVHFVHLYVRLKRDMPNL